MQFYPRLNEADDYLKIPASDLKKYVGKTSSTVKSDPVDDKVLKVDDLKRSDKITWEYVKKAGGNLKKFLHAYLTEAGYDVVDNLLRFKKGQPTDELDINFGEYWDYQVDLLRYKLGQEEKPEVEPEKTEDPDEDIPSSIPEEFEISSAVVEFFRSKGKEPQLIEWCNNIPTDTKIVREIILFFKLLDEIITNTSGKPISISGIIKIANLQVKSLDKISQDRWKKHMIEHLGNYSKPEDVNPFYIDQILKHGEFLNALFMIEATGMGRGELLMTYLIPGATFPGGGESYDLLIAGGNTYELKDYSNVEKAGKGAYDSIRLGTGGKLTRFEFWKNLENSISIAKSITDDLTDKELENLLDPYLLILWKYFISDENYNKHPKAIASAVAAGEVSDERLKLIKLWFYLVHELVNRDISEEGEDIYNIAILKGPKTKPKTISIAPIKGDALKGGGSLKIETDKNIQRSLDELATLKYVKNPDLFQEDMDDVAKEYFFHNRDIDYFLVFRPNKINIVGEDGFVFAKITQAAVKIIEKEYLKSDDIAKKAFSNWKAAIDKVGKNASSEEKKSYANIKNKLSYKDFFETAFLGENFYPRLFK